VPAATPGFFRIELLNLISLVDYYSGDWSAAYHKSIKSVEKQVFFSAMAETGDFLTMPGGARVTITTSTAETGGERVEMEFTLPPGASGPPLHFHPAQEEEWHVLEGALTVHLDGNWRELTEGESALIPRGHPHTFRNLSEQTVRVRDVHVPALDFQEYMQQLSSLTESGKVTSLKSPSSLMHLAMVVRAHRPTQLMASRAQRLGETVLASLGRLLGYRLPVKPVS
jgi:quercetin dioxygenase-like cupin family protein